MLRPYSRPTRGRSTRSFAVTNSDGAPDRSCSSPTRPFALLVPKSAEPAHWRVQLWAKAETSDLGRRA